MDEYYKIGLIFLLQLLKYLFFFWLFQSMISTFYTLVTFVTTVFLGILVQYGPPPSLPTCPLITTCQKNVCESE